MNKLSITEIYSSIQGETSFAGSPTVFVRLSGCNLRCHWCDTTHAYDRGMSYSVENIIENISSYGINNICITGGEPLLQEGIYFLITSLCDLGFIISLETNGSLSTSKVDPRVSIILDIKCPGSGVEEHNLWENLKCLRLHDEVKFVISNKEDFEYAKDICRCFGLYDGRVLFSPAFGILEPRHLTKWILDDKLTVKFNLQTHKYIWSPEKTGV